MAHDNLTYEDLLRIVELIKASEQFSQFRLKVGDIEVELHRQATAGSSRMAVPAQPTPSSAWDASMPPAQQTGPPPARADRAGPSHAAPTLPEGSIAIRAPTVGTFYRAPEPGARPFVEIGQSVEPDTIVCIVEVMKLMSSIAAGARGTVVQILAADASPVETGQPLIVLRPDAMQR